MERPLAHSLHQFPTDMCIAANSENHGTVVENPGTVSENPDTFSENPDTVRSRFRPVLIASLIAKRALRNSAGKGLTAKRPSETYLRLVAKLNPLLGEAPEPPLA